MDLSQVTLIQTVPENRFTYDEAEQNRAVLRAERRLRFRQALWLGTSGALKRYFAGIQRLLHESPQMAVRPHIAK